MLDLWKARKTPLSQLKVDVAARPQHVLVHRRGLEVVCDLLEPVQSDVIHALQNGEALGEVCSLYENEEPPIGEWFSNWASQGMIARVA